MFDDKKLWAERFGRRVKDLGRYLRYIFNGHLVVVLLFLIGTAGYYYQNWLAKLPADFPAAEIMAVAIAIFLTHSPVYNFLVEADQVYLLPLETKLSRYFYRSGLASLLLQGYILLLVLAVLMPMFAAVSTSGFRYALPFFLVLVVAKAWNLAVGWRISYDLEPAAHLWDLLVRYLINFSLLYLLFKQANLLLLVIIAVIMGFYYLFFARRTVVKGLKWDTLIGQEEKRMNSFYRLANLFTDVPLLKETVKRRKLLDFFLSAIPFSQDSTYLYLFSRTFLRSGDYLGLFIRLTIIGGLALYFFSFGLVQVFLALLFLYLTGFQLLPLWLHHQNKLWIDLYPVVLQVKRKAFTTLLSTIMLTQTILFGLFILLKGDSQIAVFEVVAGGIFSLFFVYIYSKGRLKV